PARDRLVPAGLLAHAPGTQGGSRMSRSRILVAAAAVAVAVAAATARAAGPIDAELAKYSAVPTFVAPGPAFAAGKLRGKTIFNIPATSTVPFVVQIDRSMAKIAK